MDLKHYELLSELFEYPNEDFPKSVLRVLSFLRENYSEAADQLDLFYCNLPVDNLHDMQELFTRSFDVQAITTLDIGYVLFGDDYKRGELLANLNREHKKAKNYCGSELSDHLPNVLRLLPMCNDPELLDELIGEIIAPALKKMIEEFDPLRLEKKNTLYKKHYRTLIESRPGEAAIIYCYTLKALDLVLRKDFVIKEQVVAEQSLDFLQSLGTEMVVEKIENE